MKLPTLYKLSTDKVRVNQWEIEVVNDTYRTISGFKGMIQTTSEWTTCIAKNTKKSNSTTPAQQALAEAESLWKKRIERGYVEDINKVQSITTRFEPMLAKKYEDEKDRVMKEKFVYDQPKLDGIRCITKIDGMWTRNFKRIISAPHIFEALKPLFDKDPGLILDGELYCDKLANDFNKIISLVRKTKPTAEDLEESKNIIEYHIYDIPSIPGTFKERFVQYVPLILLPSCCKWVETNLIEKDMSGNDFNIVAHYYKHINNGYEGQMIRLNGPYENKRSKYLLKNKEFITEEFEIKGVLEGKGNLSGKCGKLQFATDKGVEFEAAINATWEQLEEYWERKDELIGKLATVRYFAVTEDGSLRFPKVLEVDRWDM